MLNKIITLTFCFFLSGSLVAAEIQGKVIRVLDGDTIDVLQDKKPVRVRLLNIDAPEKKQAYGSWSTNQLGVRLENGKYPTLRQLSRQFGISKVQGQSWEKSQQVNYSLKY